MKIEKRSVNASMDPIPLVVPDDGCESGKYCAATENIKAAIDSLCVIIDEEDDQIAKDAIANLSVILLDLKSDICS